MLLWYPLAKVDALLSGTMAGGPFKGVLHSTEGKSYASARGAYVKNKSNPHFTVSFEKGKFEAWQHVPLDASSRALRNADGGVQTNRDSAIQIEIVGTCNPPNRGKAGWLFVPEAPEEYLAGIADLMAWVEAQTGIRPVSPAFSPYPASYGASPARMTGPTWDDFNGWCGHQHVPENTHGDPGDIDIARLLHRSVAPAPPSSNTKAEGMTLETISVTLPNVGAAGKGHMNVSIPFGRIAALIPQGLAPERDGYPTPFWIGAQPDGETNTRLTWLNCPDRAVVVFVKVLAP